MLSVLIFFVILAVLVLSHEFGHFLVAKFFGIRVDEFGFGFPPKLFSFKKRETEYSFNLLPFGGFVRIFGETLHEGEKDASRSFSHKSNWIQASVILAGVTFNFLLAWILLSAGFVKGLPVPTGWSPLGPTIENSRLLITDVMKDSPAEKAGIKTNDNIIYLVAKDSALQSPTVEELVNYIGVHGGEEIMVGYKRDSGTGFGDVQILKVIPKEGFVPGHAVMGVGLDMIGVLRIPIPKAIYSGAGATYTQTIITFMGLYDFATGLFTGGTESLASVSGPIGLIGIVEQSASMGWVYLLSLIALISINLGVLNVMPFPALDGGRLLFIIIGAIKRKPVKQEIQSYVNLAGFAILLLLMLVITWSDVAKLFNN